MATPINTIYSWFETGDFPTQAQFQASWSSFWHKDELIPFGRIDGLGALFESTLSKQIFISHVGAPEAHSDYLAKKDASNLTPANVNLWKVKLGVGDLPENIATYDYDLHDQVMMKDGTTKEATDLGKNVANSKPTSIAGAGLILGAPWSIDTNGQPMSVTGLANKSADSTFSRIKVQNSQGQEAIVDNPYHILKSGINTMTVPQTLEIAQLLNGGSGSAGAMSVNLISPPIVQKIDSIEYILLRGANLNLNATSKKIEILNSVTKAVVVTIPDNQIQLNADGLSLIFYYNFKDFNIGEFVIRLTSGVKVYDTSLTLKTVSSVVNIQLDSLVWELAYSPTTTPKESDLAAGRNVAITTPITGASAIPSVSAKSQELFAQGDDFCIEFNVNLGYKNSGNTQELNKTYIGIGYSNSPNTLSPNSLVNLSYGYSNNNEIIAWNNNIQAGGSEASPRTITVIIIKTGNLFRTVIGSTNHQVTLSNNSGYSMFVNLVPRNAGAQILQTQIIKAYKFN